MIVAMMYTNMILYSSIARGSRIGRERSTREIDARISTGSVVGLARLGLRTFVRYRPPRFCSRNRTFFRTIEDQPLASTVLLRQRYLNVHFANGTLVLDRELQLLRLTGPACIKGRKTGMDEVDVPTGSYFSMLRGLCVRGRTMVL